MHILWGSSSERSFSIVNKDKWGFVAKEQGEGQWMGKLEEETSGEGGLLLTHSTEF